MKITRKHNIFASRDARTNRTGSGTRDSAAAATCSPMAPNGCWMRTMFHYYATGVTPAMTAARPGSGAAYAAARDAQGRYFDGSKTYKVTLPGPVLAANFWSFTIYDNQTRSMLETDQTLASIDSTLPAMQKNADGSVTVWFGLKAPTGQEGDWVQTKPGKSWSVILRLYGPLQPWFDQSWKPGDVELVM